MMNNQMNNAVRKIHNLHSSGAVTVTGLSQPRILKQKFGSGVVTSSNAHHTSHQQQQAHHVNTSNRCYVCDDALGSSQQQNVLTETQTSHTATKFPNKIGQLVGDAFMVIVSVDDVVCARCTNLLNYLDRLENDVERVRTNLMNLLHKKYGLNDDSGGGGGGGALSPPIKMQKLNSGSASRTAEDSSGIGSGGGDVSRVRKIVSSDATIGKQSPPVVSAVQQMKISTQGVTQNTSVGGTQTQTFQRKTTRIYKCISCDYKTSDMRLFNTHYETCKSQNFQCKNCKKIFPNFGSMKQHMVREHNTTMDNTCAVCHINFVNEPALRKHMEANHSTNVVVTSTTTLPLQQASDANAATTPLYTCNHCQFKSTDKALFDEHFRKHLSGVKPKPFKCRLCAQRFETREAATIHAKQHQPNYFKCGTCSMSFPKRELLVKHFEVHQQPQQQQNTVVQHQQVVTQSAPMVKQVATTKQQHTTPQNILTTQKLLQETIDEALSDNTTTVVSSGNTDVNTAANNIRFFSCHICSLTFIQEHYYNQHMEAHSQDKEGVGSGGTSGTTITTTTSSASSGGGGHNMLHPTAAALLNDDHKGNGGDSGDMSSHHGGGSGVEADIESIFEKMHSEKNDNNGSENATVTSASNSATPTNTTSSAAGQSGNENLVITSQQGSGGITFNITIPQPDAVSAQEASENSKSIPTTTAPVSVSIDMPVLDQNEESATSAAGNKTGVRSSKDEKSRSNSAERKITGPVSMPSLDDDNDSQEPQHNTQTSSVKKDKTILDTKKVGDSADKRKSVENDDTLKEAKESVKEEQTGSSAPQETSASDAPSENAAADAAGGEGEGEHEGQQQVAMELDEAMQAQVEGGQIKFILNENGQLLQLDNHIITDADGNQILVQDPEQIQQLLQSAGLLQSGDGLDGETLQMMTDANGQMVLVQGENNETQLIDASLLNADGQLVIQQGHDGDLGEGAHVIGEDGTRIPVSVSYTADGQPIVRVQQQMLESAGGEDEEHHQEDSTVAATTEEGASQVDADSSAAAPTTAEASADPSGETAAEGSSGSGGADESTAGADAAGAAGSTSGGNSGGDFFPLEDLMQHSTENKPAAE